MKKLYYLLLLLPMFFMASCTDDDDLPNVDITVQMNNVAVDGNVIYVVQDEPMEIESVSAQGLGGKAALVANVRYNIDYAPLYYSIVSPFSCAIDMKTVPVGKHLISLEMTVLQVDKSIAYSVIGFDIKVVPSKDLLPDGLELGPYTFNTTTSQSKDKPSGK